MIVTDIVELNKSKSKIYIDHEFAFVLYKGEICKNHIREGEELPQQVYDLLTGEILPKRAKLRAMHLLTKRPYTEKKLRQKLAEGLYTEACINIAIDYVKSYGYIDDTMYAKDFISYHSGSLSRRQIEVKLMQKGIAKDIIRDAYEEECPQKQEELELEQISRLFIKKYHGIVPEDAKERMKMMQFFQRKGYAQSMINKVINAVGQDDILDELYN